MLWPKSYDYNSRTFNVFFPLTYTHVWHKQASSATKGDYLAISLKRKIKSWFLKANYFKRATFCLEAHKNLGKFRLKKGFLNPEIQHVLRILHSSVISFSLLLYSVANLLWNESHLSQSTHTVVSRIPSAHSCTRKKNFFVPKVTLRKAGGSSEMAPSGWKVKSNLQIMQGWDVGRLWGGLEMQSVPSESWAGTWQPRCNQRLLLLYLKTIPQQLSITTFEVR